MQLYDPLCRIDIYSHFFTITKYTPRISGLVYRFSWKYTEADYTRGNNGRAGSVQKTPGKTYGIYNSFVPEFRFHIGQLAALLELFKREYIEPHLYTWVVHELYEPDRIDIELGNYTPYDYQYRAIDFNLAPDEEGDLRTRFVAMPTGTGKTLTSLAGTADPRCRVRTLVTALPKYLKKWPDDVVEYTTAQAKRVVVIGGGKNIKGLIQQASEGNIPYDFILVSLVTLRLWYDAHEKDPIGTEEEYGCHPQDFCKLIKIGQIIVDEAHESLHALYRMMCYTHVPKFIGLSGTLVHREPFVERIQHMMFPRELRFNEIKMKKYIRCVALAYRFDDFENSNIKTTERGSSTYSQTAYEISIIKNKRKLERYLKFHEFVVEQTLLRDYKPGDKMLIFAGRIEMCTIIAEHLKKKFPQFDVKRYADGDPYSNLMEPDIRVSTLLSAGTAHDIKGLRYVHMSNSIQSVQQNLQALGRLRELKDRDVEFWWSYCEQIEKHVNYHKERKELFQDRVVGVREYVSPFMI